MNESRYSRIEASPQPTDIFDMRTAQSDRVSRSNSERPWTQQKISQPHTLKYLRIHLRSMNLWHPDYDLYFSFPRCNRLQEASKGLKSFCKSTKVFARNGLNLVSPTSDQNEMEAGRTRLRTMAIERCHRRGSRRVVGLRGALWPGQGETEGKSRSGEKFVGMVRSRGRKLPCEIQSSSKQSRSSCHLWKQQRLHGVLESPIPRLCHVYNVEPVCSLTQTHKLGQTNSDESKDLDSSAKHNSDALANFVKSSNQAYTRLHKGFTLPADPTVIHEPEVIVTIALMRWEIEESQRKMGWARKAISIQQAVQARLHNMSPYIPLVLLPRLLYQYCRMLWSSWPVQILLWFPLLSIWQALASQQSIRLTVSNIAQPHCCASCSY